MKPPNLLEENTIKRLCEFFDCVFIKNRQKRTMKAQKLNKTHHSCTKAGLVEDYTSLSKK